jgi:diacylglycerol kinase (ATP)
LKYQNAALIYNPSAGKFRWRRGLVRRVVAALEEAGHRVTPLETEGPGTAGRLARARIEAGADLVLTLGGDGTLNEVLPGVIGTSVPVAMIPAGTANVFTREVGLGANPIQVARRLAECVPQRVAAGLLRSEPGQQERHFLLMAGIGFDAHIVYQLSLPLKARLGQFAYWVASFRELTRRLDESQVEVNGETFTCSFALASRVRNYAGYLRIARRVSLLEPEFEFVLFEGTSTIRYYLKYLAAVMLTRSSNMRGISFLRGRTMRITGPPDTRVYIQVDGEYAGRLPATVEILPDAVTLLLPPEYLKG